MASFPVNVPNLLMILGVVLVAFPAARLLITASWAGLMKILGVPPAEIASYVKAEARKDPHRVLVQLIRSWSK